MFFNRRSRDEMYEARIADIKEASEARHREMMRLVDALAEQVEYLRAQLGRPFLASQHKGINPTDQRPVLDENGLEAPLHMSEAEEDLIALLELGHVDEYEYAAQLERIRSLAGVSSLTVDSGP